MNQIKQLRKEKGWTVGELAEKTYFSKSKIYQIESGDKRVSPSDLFNLAVLFGASMAYVGGYSDERKQSFARTKKDVSNTRRRISEILWSN